MYRSYSILQFSVDWVDSMNCERKRRRRNQKNIFIQWWEIGAIVWWLRFFFDFLMKDHREMHFVSVIDSENVIRESSFLHSFVQRCNASLYVTINKNSFEILSCVTYLSILMIITGTIRDYITYEMIFCPRSKWYLCSFRENR